MTKHVNIYAGSYWNQLLLSLVKKELISSELSPMMRSNYEHLRDWLQDDMDKYGEKIADIESRDIEPFG